MRIYFLVLLAIMIFPVVQHIVLRYPLQLPWDTTMLELILIYFAVIGNVTALQRFFSTLRWFKKK